MSTWGCAPTTGARSKRAGAVTWRCATATTGGATRSNCNGRSRRWRPIPPAASAIRGCAVMRRRRGVTSRTTRWGAGATTFEELLLNNTIPNCAAVVRRDLLAGYYADPELRPLERPWPLEDYPMWLWMAPRCTIRFLDCETAVFRVLPDSGSHQSSLERRIVYFDAIFRYQVLVRRPLRRRPSAAADRQDAHGIYPHADEGCGRRCLSAPLVARRPSGTLPAVRVERGRKAGMECAPAALPDMNF